MKPTPAVQAKKERKAPVLAEPERQTIVFSAG
jgi:hypothetical protein